MGRIRKTFGNWRWWLILPVAIGVGLPLSIVSGILWAGYRFGEVCESAYYRFNRACSPIAGVLRKFAHPSPPTRGQADE